MVVAEVYMSPEMIAAGLEAMREAKLRCLEDGDVVIEVYLAMYGTAIKCVNDSRESIH